MSGYEPVVVINGEQALASALGPDAPSVILLDWSLPDIDGLAVCRKLRESSPRIRPYIVMLSGKNAKKEIAAGLDAGADDFVSKPFNVEELQARLRVAKRLVDHQRALLKQIADNEILIGRDSLLSELIAKRQSAEPPRPKATPTKPPAGVKTTGTPKPTDFSDQEIRYMLSIALLEIRVALQGLVPQAKLREQKGAAHFAWGGLLMPQHDLWLDFIVSSDFAAAEALFEQSLGRKAKNEIETSGFMAEVTRMIAVGFTRLLQARAGEVLQPLMSRSLRRRSADTAMPVWGGFRAYDLTVESQALQLVITREPCPRRIVAPAGVREFDVLDGPFPPREMSAIPMFNTGVILTPRFVDKIATHDMAVQQGECVAVRRPTKLANYFNSL